MKLEFNAEKNAKLVAERKISFEAIITAIKDGKSLKLRDHPNPTKYPNQKAFYVEIHGEIYVVPFVQKDDKTIFLKTIFPSCKARKKFLTKKTKKIRTKKS